MFFYEQTAQFTNAVLTALLPMLAQYGEALELRLPTPLTRAAVQWVRVNDLTNISAHIVLTNGFDFHFSNGRVARFEDRPNSPLSKRVEQRTHLVGEPRMTTNDVIAFVRQRLTRLGFPTNRTLLDLPPVVSGPRTQSDGKTLPFFFLKWPTVFRTASEHDNTTAFISDRYPIEVEVDAARLRITRLSMSHRVFTRDQPRLNFRPTLLSTREEPRPAYVKAITHAFLPDATNLVRKLGVPFSLPKSRLDLARTHCVPGYFLAFELTDETTFLIGVNGHVKGVRAGGAFFPWHDDPFHWAYSEVDSFFGEWHMTEAEAIDLARAVFLRTGLPPAPFGVDRPPTLINKPPQQGHYVIPRYQIVWQHSATERIGSPDSTVLVEIDAGRKQVMSFYHSHTTFLKRPWPVVSEPATNAPFSLRSLWPF